MIFPRRPYRPGEALIYRETRYSTKPEHSAREVVPDPHGEGYRYTLARALVVVALEDGRVLCRAGDGRVLALSADCPDLRRATIWERWLA